MFALLVMTLDAAVPLNIMEFARRGGPDKADYGVWSGAGRKRRRVTFWQQTERAGC
jgi:hypothetical protein